MAETSFPIGGKCGQLVLVPGIANCDSMDVDHDFTADNKGDPMKTYAERIEELEKIVEQLILMVAVPAEKIQNGDKKKKGGKK
jgi:hypothetical protein